MTAVLDDPAYAWAATATESEIAAMPSAADVLDDPLSLAQSERQLA